MQPMQQPNGPGGVKRSGNGKHRMVAVNETEHLCHSQRPLEYSVEQHSQRYQKKQSFHIAVISVGKRECVRALRRR